MSQPFPELQGLLDTVVAHCSADAAVVLFGSRARGDNDAWSDWDLLVLSEEFDERQRNAIDRVTADIKADLMILSVAEYEARLTQWLANEEGAAPKTDVTHADLGRSYESVQGICLAGTQTFERFQTMVASWAAAGRIRPASMRRLADVSDGLNEVQRVLLNSFPRSASRFIKSARFVGDAAKHGVAGASFLYRLLTKMTQHWITRYPLIDTQGNLGSQSGARPAAMRYTEAKLSRFALAGQPSDDAVSAEEILAAAEAVRALASEPNVSRKKVEATLKSSLKSSVSPSPWIFPNLLANGTLLIPGAESAVPSFWLPAVVDALRLAADSSTTSDAALIDCIGLPDFASGGKVVDTDQARSAFESGVGPIAVAACCRVGTVQEAGDQETSGRCVVVHNLPYGATGWELQAELASMLPELPGVTKVVDRSDLETGTIVELHLSKGADPETVLKRASNAECMHAEFPLDFTVLRDETPTRLSLAELIRSDVEARLRRLDGSRKRLAKELDSIRQLGTDDRRGAH